MKKITFKGAQGDDLSARLDIPQDQPVKAYALFAHCFTCGKDIFAANKIAKGLNDHGVAVFRFDFTGLGMSDGEFANTNFSSNAADLIAAADYMREHYEAPALIIGHSLGGSAVLYAASDIAEAKAVVTIGSPSDVAHVSHHFHDSEEEIMEKGEAEVLLAGRPFKIKRQFIEDIRGVNLQEKVEKLKKALLIMHAPMDETVGIDSATNLFVWAKHPKSFLSLDDATHLINKPEDAKYAAYVIASWVSRYID